MYLHNIEKSGFRKGEYVGYANGVWRIKRMKSVCGNWVARHQDNPQMPALWAHTLKDLSEQLAQHAGEK